MVGENGVPETPDWQPEPRMAPRLDDATRARALAAEPTVVYYPSSRTAEPYEAAAVAENIVLGEN